ncbi:MAG: hypothetical protein ACRDNG_06755, partial [Gaiellaceae bacterium]
MARRRASMREGPLAELFRATEAAQRQSEKEGEPGGRPDPDATVESAAPVAPEALGAEPAHGESTVGEPSAPPEEAMGSEEPKPP